MKSWIDIYAKLHGVCVFNKELALKIDDEVRNMMRIQALRPKTSRMTYAQNDPVDLNRMCAMLSKTMADIFKLRFRKMKAGRACENCGAKKVQTCHRFGDEQRTLIKKAVLATSTNVADKLRSLAPNDPQRAPFRAILALNPGIEKESLASFSVNEAMAWFLRAHFTDIYGKRIILFLCEPCHVFYDKAAKKEDVWRFLEYLEQIPRDELEKIVIAQDNEAAAKEAAASENGMGEAAVVPPQQQETKTKRAGATSASAYLADFMLHEREASHPEAATPAKRGPIKQMGPLAKKPKVAPVLSK